MLGLLFPLLAPPLAWTIHLALNFGLASHACFPDGEPLAVPPAGFDWLRLLLLVVDLGAMAVAVIAVAVAYRSWMVSARELAATEARVMEEGESRTRFLAIWGTLIGAGFLIAILFDFVGLWVLPICG
jgi:hypothetical protein